LALKIDRQACGGSRSVVGFVSRTKKLIADEKKFIGKLNRCNDA